MNINQFFKIVDLQEPLYCVNGDIFETPAKHIAFAVNYPGKRGGFGNTSGFAGEVIERYWPELNSIRFEKGEPVTRFSNGKYFHALPVHSNEENGWEEAPDLIELCLNKLPVNSTEVVTCVLMGGGTSGKKWGASIRNIGGMLASMKTVVLYVFDPEMYYLLAGTGIIAPCLRLGKMKQFRIANGESVDEIRRLIVA